MSHTQHHLVLGSFTDAQMKPLSAYCYTCKTQAEGAEVLMHLYFGGLKCKHCQQQIRSCNVFRKTYPPTDTCQANKSGHKFGWSAKTRSYLYSQASLAAAIGSDSVFSAKSDGTYVAIINYMYNLMPLRNLDPWRDAIDEIKENIELETVCNNPMPPLQPCRVTRRQINENKGVDQPTSQAGMSGMEELGNYCLPEKKRKEKRQKKSETTPERKIENSRRELTPAREVFAATQAAGVTQPTSAAPQDSHTTIQVSSTLPDETTASCDRMVSQSKDAPATTLVSPNGQMECTISVSQSNSYDGITVFRAKRKHSSTMGQQNTMNNPSPTRTPTTPTKMATPTSREPTPRTEPHTPNTVPVKDEKQVCSPYKTTHKQHTISTHKVVVPGSSGNITTTCTRLQEEPVTGRSQDTPDKGAQTRCSVEVMGNEAVPEDCPTCDADGDDIRFRSINVESLTVLLECLQCGLYIHVHPRPGTPRLTKTEPRTPARRHTINTKFVV